MSDFNAHVRCVHRFVRVWVQVRVRVRVRLQVCVCACANLRECIHSTLELQTQFVTAHSFDFRPTDTQGTGVDWYRALQLLTEIWFVTVHSSLSLSS